MAFKSRTIIALTLLGGAELATDLIVINTLLFTVQLKRKVGDTDMAKRDKKFKDIMVKKFRKLKPGEYIPYNYIVTLTEAMLDLSNSDNLRDCNGLGGSKPKSAYEILRKHELIGEKK